MACLSHAFLMLMFSCQPAEALVADLDDILLRNSEALGGDKAWQQIDNLRFQLDIREPGFEVDGLYVATREMDMRIDIEADGQRVFSEGLFRGRAWQWSVESGWSLANDAGAAALRHGLEAPGRFYTLQQLRQRGATVELSEPALLAQPQEWQLEVTLPDGARIFYFIDRESFLPTREITRRAFHPDLDRSEIPVETTFADAFSVDGIVRFQRSDSHNLVTGEWLGTSIVRTIEHNVNLPTDFFSPPTPALATRSQP